MASRLVALLTLVLLANPVVSAPQRPQAVAQVPSSQHPSSTSESRYDGHSVWRLDWTDADEDLHRSLSSTFEELNLDVWRASPAEIDLRLSPSQLAHLDTLLPPSAKLQPYIPDLQHLVDLSKPKKKRPSSPDEWDLDFLNCTFHDAYHPLDEVDAFGEKLVGRFGAVDRFEVGKSWEGRTIWGYRVRKESTELKGNKGKTGTKLEYGEKVEMIIQSGQHAREWVGPASALYLLHSFALDAETPSSLTDDLLDHFDFTFVPTINPDGYVYSHDHSRMWRKNRQAIGSRKGCVGVDLNSNWGYKWRPSKSANPCSENFPGEEAFQAPETSAIATYISNGSADGLSGGAKVRSFVDLHSYGQLFMFPFAHSCSDFPPDAEFLMEAALGVSKAMRSTGGETYQAGQACSMTYRAPGDAIDFVYGVTDVRWTYSAELRDTGTYGFMLPPKLIRPTANEVLEGVTYLAKFIYKWEIEL